MNINVIKWTTYLHPFGGVEGKGEGGTVQYWMASYKNKQKKEHSNEQKEEEQKKRRSEE